MNFCKLWVVQFVTWNTQPHTHTLTTEFGVRIFFGKMSEFLRREFRFISWKNKSETQYMRHVKGRKEEKNYWKLYSNSTQNTKPIHTANYYTLRV